MSGEPQPGGVCMQPEDRREAKTGALPPCRPSPSRALSWHCCAAFFINSSHVISPDVSYSGVMTLEAIKGCSLDSASNTTTYLYKARQELTRGFSL